MTARQNRNAVIWENIVLDHDATTFHSCKRHGNLGNWPHPLHLPVPQTLLLQGFRVSLQAFGSGCIGCRKRE